MFDKIDDGIEPKHNLENFNKKYIKTMSFIDMGLLMYEHLFGYYFRLKPLLVQENITEKSIWGC